MVPHLLFACLFALAPSGANGVRIEYNALEAMGPTGWFSQPKATKAKALAPSKSIVLVSRGKERKFKISCEAAQMSEFLKVGFPLPEPKEVVEGEAEEGVCNEEEHEANLPNVGFRILSKVVNYMKKHTGDPNTISSLVTPLKSGNLSMCGASTWDKDFVDTLTPEELFQLVDAAEYLSIKGLRDLACAGIASLAIDQTRDQFLAKFSIGGHLTQAEMERLGNFIDHPLGALLVASWRSVKQRAFLRPEVWKRVMKDFLMPPFTSNAVYAVRNTYEDGIGKSMFVVLPASFEERESLGLERYPEAENTYPEHEFKFRSAHVERWSLPLPEFPTFRMQIGGSRLSEPNIVHSPDASLVAIADVQVSSSPKYTVHIAVVDVAQKKLLWSKTFETSGSKHARQDVVFTPDGKYIVAYIHNFRRQDIAGLQWFDSSTGVRQARKSWQWPGRGEWVTRLAFHPSGNVLACVINKRGRNPMFVLLDSSHQVVFGTGYVDDMILYSEGLDRRMSYRQDAFHPVISFAGSRLVVGGTGYISLEDPVVFAGFSVKQSAADGTWKVHQDWKRTFPGTFTMISGHTDQMRKGRSREPLALAASPDGASVAIGWYGFPAVTVIDPVNGDTKMDVGSFQGKGEDVRYSYLHGYRAAEDFLVGVRALSYSEDGKTIHGVTRPTEKEDTKEFSMKAESGELEWKWKPNKDLVEFFPRADNAVLCRDEGHLCEATYPHDYVRHKINMADLEQVW